MDVAAHWSRIYRSHPEEELSWHEATPETSLRRIQVAIDEGATSLIDVGGGASRLVDRLVDLPFERLAVLDISGRALSLARARLGNKARRVEWVTADITRGGDLGGFDVWHDRAVFHFLLEEGDRERYVSRCAATLSSGGMAVVATFASDGPETCSGLPVRRYDPRGLARECGEEFELLDSERHVHVTPAGRLQPFTYASFRRKAALPVLARA